ncbi:hypothetical protein [Ancylobacter amanitiformis]|uniref:GH24 family phage-related lysozyme (Muramidase) n=1 Tax=Ancylobacter amanitiformis TaxID=217069 RepID=A0ABU0LTX0_9HYPH|nr:hypothetical protein [Ancylobacter amanitiformis]MDQ0512157.1 GH24 family phage-related lysozyme (muramidase) [Ancylobacter amanitiformis]
MSEDPTTAGLSTAEITATEALLGYRERDAFDAAERAEGGDEALVGVLATVPSPAALAAAARVSGRAFRLIVDYETGGRSYYERIIKSRPIWPKASSGVTIGFGYDLGYVGPDEYRKDWSGLIAILSAPQRAALEACIGHHSGRDSAATMTALVGSVRDIVVSWELSEAVFRARTLPKYALQTANALPNTDRLNGDCFGTLVSLTFNRGASYGKAFNPATDPKDRYREMRAIKAAMVAGAHADIPRQIKAMIRIWAGTAVEEGMRRRRTDEAALFLDGLAAGAPAGGPAVAALEEPGAFIAAAGAGAGAGEGLVASTFSDEDNWVETSEDDLAEMALDGFAIGVAAAGASWAADAVQPDYAHLGEGLTLRVPFALTADDLALLAALNDFDVAALANDTPVLFGLRGAGIVKDHTAREGITLVDQRPDHALPRCVIGAWDVKAGKVSVFPASTVPNQAAVATFRNRGTSGNLLPTGLYHYVCGAHVTSRATPGCFLLRKPDMSKRMVVVRRSKDDLAYETTDLVDRCQPGDNIHPAFFSQPTGFSSFGCQTVTGTFRDGVHSGPWAAFRKAAGLVDVDGAPGRRYLYMLLTGAEARLASRLRLDGLADDPVARRRLRRLRAGSTGPAARRLQERLGLAGPDGELGPVTAESLHRFQAARGGGSDGIFTPELDATLGWQVFAAGASA